MTTTTQISRPAPWMEDYIKSLYTDAQAQVAKDVGQFPPAYQIAGLSPLETQAAGVLQGGIGSWAPIYRKRRVEYALERALLAKPESP